MGNCAAQCCSEEGPDTHQKTTVEPKDGERNHQQNYNNNVAYINEHKQEFEIEYGSDTKKQQKFAGDG